MSTGYQDRIINRDGNNPNEAAAEAIDRISELLEDLTAKLDQAHAEHTAGNWARIGSLNYVIRNLDAINRFWNTGTYSAVNANGEAVRVTVPEPQ